MERPASPSVEFFSHGGVNKISADYLSVRVRLTDVTTPRAASEKAIEGAGSFFFAIYQPPRLSPEDASCSRHFLTAGYVYTGVGDGEIGTQVDCKDELHQNQEGLRVSARTLQGGGRFEVTLAEKSAFSNDAPETASSS